MRVQRTGGSKGNLFGSVSEWATTRTCGGWPGGKACVVLDRIVRRFPIEFLGPLNPRFWTDRMRLSPWGLLIRCIVGRREETEADEYDENNGEAEYQHDQQRHPVIPGIARDE